MSESSLAADPGEQETGIRVDLDSDDPKTQVTRAKPRAAASPRPKNWGAERADTSREVKKRIARIESRFNQQLAEQQAEFQRQLAERDKRIDGMRPTSEATSSDDQAHETAMAKMQADLEDAQERGDSKAVAKITADMSRAEGRFWAMKAAKQGVTDKTNDKGTAPTTQTTTQPAKTQPTKAGVAWAKANGDWWNDTHDDVATDARNYANSIFQRKRADGEDHEDPAFYEEIGALVRKRFPELEVKSAMRSQRRDDADDDYDEGDVPADQDDRVHRNPRRQAPPQMPNRGDVPRGQRLQQLTRDDIKTMREVGMNPDDNKHVVQFLRSKVETEADA